MPYQPRHVWGRLILLRVTVHVAEAGMFSNAAEGVNALTRRLRLVVLYGVEGFQQAVFC